jgi:hypothetical protein
VRAYIERLYGLTFFPEKRMQNLHPALQKIINFFAHIATFIDGLIETWMNFLVRVWRLEDWGENMSRRARSSLQLFALLLNLIFFMEWGAWGLLATMFAPTAIAAIIGIIPAFVFVFIDRAIVLTASKARDDAAEISDFVLQNERGVQTWWVRNRSKVIVVTLLAMRAGVITVEAYYTHTPLVHLVFGGEIEKKIADQEQRQKSGIMDKAIADAEKRFDDRIAKAKKLNNTNRGSAHTETENKVKASVAQRKTDRAELVKKQQKAITRVEANQHILQETIFEETADGGCGKVCREKKEQLVKVEKQLADLRKQNSDNLNHFDSETNKQVASIRAGGDAQIVSIEGLEDRKRAEVSRIRNLSHAAFSQEFPGEWRLARGWLQSDRALEELKNGPDGAAVRSTDNKLWGMIMLILFAVMLMKAFEGKKLSLYLSKRWQAANDNPEAQRELGLDGVNNFGNYNTKPEVRSLQSKVYEARLAIIPMIEQAERFLHELCKPVEGTNRCLSHEEITRQFQQYWEADGRSEQWATWRTTEDRAERTGFSLEDVPRIVEVDRYWAPIPYRISTEDLTATYSWVNPQPVIEAASNAAGLLRDGYRQIEIFFEDAHRALLHALIVDGSDFNSQILGRVEQFEGRVRPILNQVESGESTVHAGGLEVPECPWTVLFLAQWPYVIDEATKSIISQRNWDNGRTKIDVVGLMNDLLQNRATVEQEAIKARQAMTLKVVEDPTVSVSELRKDLGNAWTTNMQTSLEEIARIEIDLRGNVEIPDWSEQDPRNHAGAYWQIDETELGSYGWTGSNHRVPSTQGLHDAIEASRGQHPQLIPDLPPRGPSQS